MYAAHILNNVHKNGPMNNCLSLLKQVSKHPSVNSFEQCYIHIHLYSYYNKLVHEQRTGEHNPF